MSREIRINAPGAGEWVMERVNGYFTPGIDQVISTHHADGRIRGGFVLSAFLGASMTVHAAGIDEHWCTRDLLWMCFHYPYCQLGVRKLIALVASTNYPAMSSNLRAGWRLAGIVRDAYPDGHMMVLTMERDECPWLRLSPQLWLYPGKVKPPEGGSCGQQG